jgi:hypothetical protein
MARGHRYVVTVGNKSQRFERASEAFEYATRIATSGGWAYIYDRRTGERIGEMGEGVRVRKRRRARRTRRNPDPILWLVPLGIIAGWLLLRGGRAPAATRPGAWMPEYGPPKAPTEMERAEMERRYRYRYIGGGRCWDYKDRKAVDATFCQ